MGILSGVRAKVITTVLVTVVTGSAFGYWSLAEYEQRKQRDEITAMVRDTGERLRAALAKETHAATSGNAEALRSYYDHAVAVDGHLHRLRAMEAASAGHFADAADDYLLTSREILLRRASSQRHGLRLAEDLKSLHQHMRADNRTGAWISQAVRTKERVEEDYRDFRVASTALGVLLESFPAAQAKIAPHVEAALLIEDHIVSDARQRVAVAAREAARELDRYANLDTYR